MRAITNITIQVNITHVTVTMFLTYNNNSNDYGFTVHGSVEEALQTLPVDDYFPIRTDQYTLKVQGGKDEKIKLKRD